MSTSPLSSNFLFTGFGSSSFTRFRFSFPLSRSFFMPLVVTAPPICSSLLNRGIFSEFNNSRRKSSAFSSAFRLAASEWNFLTWAFKSSFLEYVLGQWGHCTRCSEVPQCFLWREKFPLLLIFFPHLGQARGYITLHMIDVYTATQGSQLIVHYRYPTFIPFLFKGWRHYLKIETNSVESANPCVKNRGHFHDPRDYTLDSCNQIDHVMI